MNIFEFGELIAMISVSYFIEVKIKLFIMSYLNYNNNHE